MPQEPGKKRSDRILEEIKQTGPSGKNAYREEEKVKLVLFRLDGHRYAFPGDHIKEILRVEKISVVPGTPDFILGILNVRGNVESVITIHPLLGLSRPSTTDKSRIVMAAGAEIRSGILVDSVQDVVDVPRSAIAPPPGACDPSIREVLAGEVLYEGVNLVLLDTAKILRKILA